MDGGARDVTVRADARVCPECGVPAGSSPFCANCGLNLSSTTRLPTRAEWEAGTITASPAGEGARRRRSPVLWALLVVVVTAGVAAAVLLTDGSDGRTTTYTVPSEAMEPTYDVGEEIAVDLDAYKDSEPAVGDVVIFHPPSGADSGIGCGIQPRLGEVCAKPTSGRSRQVFLKRVIAGPGDTVSITKGHAVVNGQVKAESFAARCQGGVICNMPRTITI